MSGSAGSTLTPEEIDALTPETTARPERYLPTLSEEEIDQLRPGEITPEQVDRLEPGPEAYGRPVADLQQTTRGGPRRELPSAGEAFASFRQELPEGLPNPRSAGPAFAYAGNIARAVPADVAALAYPEAGGNIQAALTQPVGTKLPIDTAIDAAKAEEQDRPWYRKTSTLATISQGLARTAPKIGAIGATGAVSTAAGFGTTGTLLSEMFTAGGLFGLDEEGNFHPKEAAIGAALPGIGAATRLAVAKSIGTVLKNGDLFGSKSAAELLAQPVAQKVVETAGEQASLNAFTVAMDMPRLAQLYHDNPKEFQGELAELIGSNLAFGLLGVRKVTDSRIPSETQRWIVRNAEALSKKQVLQSIAPGTLAEIWNSDPATASPEVNDIRRMIFENLDPATADQAFQKGVLVIGQEWPRLLAKAIGVMPRTVDVIPSAVPITGGRRRALLPTTTGEANAIDTEQQQESVQPERERIDAERQAAAKAGGGDRIPGTTGQPPPIVPPGGQGVQGATGQNLPAGETVPAPPAKPAVGVGATGWYYDTPTGYSSAPVTILEELERDKVGRRRFKIKMPQGHEINVTENDLTQKTPREVAKSQPSPAKPTLTLQEFAKQYRAAFEAANRYTPNQVGAQIHIERMAALADQHPEWAKLVESIPELKPNMATAKAVFHMTPEEFRVAFPTGGFNHINLPLGQNVTDAELEKLRQFAGFQQTAMADAFEKAQKSKTDADMQAAMDESHKLQFFNEAIAEAEKKRATGQPTASAGHTEPNPSPAQIEAGNAPKRTIKLHGLDISIENEKGGIRRSKPGAKEKWEVTMPAAYGYIKGTVGKDKDHIDVYVGDNPASDLVVVIDQMNPDTKAFDEHKVMLGFDKVADAVKTYERAFSDGKGSDRILDVNAVVMSEFKKWLKEGDHKKPFGDWLPEAKPATKPTVRKAGDLEGLTEAELDAMLDEAAKPVAKAAPAAKPERPAHILALEKEVAAGKGDEPYMMAGGSPLGISKKQYLEMSGLSSYDQTEKFGYSIADLMEKLTTGTMPRPRRAPAAKPKGAVQSIPKEQWLEYINELEGRGPLRKRTRPSGQKPKEKTAKDIAADAAKAGVKGVDEAMQGLHKLFGGGKHMGAGPTFDEKTYQEAKPHFESAWEQFRKAGKSLADFLRFILEKFGVGVRAYIKRFIQEKQAGLQKTAQPPTVPADVNRPTEGPSGGGGVGGAIPATPGATGQGGQSAAPAARPGGEIQPAGGPPDEGTAGAPGRPGGGAVVPDADRVPTGGTTGGQGTTERPAVGGGGEGAATVPGQPAAPASPVVSPPLGEPETTLPTETAPPQPKNLRLTENPAPTGAVARVNANIAAIELVKDLEKRGVFPTDAERAILAQWSGWGSFKELFNDRRADRRDQDPGWVKRYGKAYDKLKKLLTDAEFLAAIESSVNAHFSDPQVIKPMWTLTRRLGFKGGRVLESAVGRGDFIGFSPADLNLRWTMVELEPITARIAGYLYPEADLRIGGFEDAKLPLGYYDLNITNVPFFERGPGHEFPTMNLHNYFIGRGLSMLKPGGLLLVITSKGTMDAEFDQRQILAGMGQLIGAIRLPSNAFKESAATEVVTDIIAIRKPDGKPFDQAQDWLNTVSIDVKGTPYNINEYYAKHPDMVLGRAAMTGSLYGRGDSYNVESTGGDIGPKLAAAIAKFPENVIQIERAAKPAAEEIAAGGMTSLEDYSLSLNAKGQVVEARNFQLERPSWDTGNDTLRKRAKQYVQLRDVLRAQYGLERDKDATDAAIDANRKKLQAAYLAWTKANGTLNLNARKNDFLSSDSGYYTVLGLENVTQEADPKDASKARTVIKPADVLSVRTLMPDRPPEKVESAADALAVSLSYSGVLDLAYIKQLTGLTDEQIESDLIAANLAYKDPESGQLQTVADYLTGDVRDKLAKAMFAAKDNAAFERNVEALKSVIPDTVPFDRVSVDITARWTPVPVLNKFAVQELGLPENIVGFTPVIEEFSVRAIERISDRARTEWSTAKMAAPELLRHALNFKRALIREWDPVDEKYVKDEAGTALANQMIDAIKKRYAEWIRQTDHTTAYRFFDSKIGQYRTEEMPIWEVMEREFNRVSNSFVVPENDGSKLTLPGLSTMVRRTQHLLNGVQRGINEGHAVFAHGVGSGKTFMGIVLGHELQRVGLARKFLHVVKKPTVDQYRVSLQRAYPGSKVLIPSKKDFDRENRQKLLSRIASGRWDAVVLTHEQFKSISPGESMVNEFFDEQIQQLLQILREAGGSEADVDAKSTRNLDPSVRNIVRKIKSMRKRMDEHIASIRKRQDTIKWEDLNVDGVFIDESHAFKNMPLATNMENDVKGIPSDFSQRAVDLLVKVRDIQRRTNGRNVFFASGTPISNTLAELWVQFHATAPQMLKDLHVETFDSFASTFADVVTSFELGWDGKTFKDVTRMSRFKNPSGLTTLTRLGMDVKIGNKELGLDVPDVEGGKPEVVVIKPTAAFMRCAALVERIADMWDTLDPKGRYDNSWVPIATMRMGVAAALDPRLVLPDAEDDPNSKVNTSIGHIFEEWEKGKDRRTTMMVFADLFQTMSTAKLMAFIGGEKVDTSSAEIDVEGQDASNEEGDAGSSEEEARARGAIGKFNLYNDIRAKLVARGVPESEIAIITEHDTDAKRDDLFNKVRNGIVRILMGSTEKIGEGVDVPQRMSAQFHLDPPMQMTPAKMEQRIGRIIRQGNLHSPKNWNLPVRVFMYAQEKSMDAAIYQMLETKGTMVLQALKGQFLGDSFEDPASELTTTMAMMKAAATGDDRAIRLAMLIADVRDLSVQEGAFLRRQSELRRATSEEDRAMQTDQRNAADNDKLAKLVEGIVADKEKVSIYHSFTQKRVTGEEAIKEWLKTARAAIEEKCKDIGNTAEMHFLINDTLRLKYDVRRFSKTSTVESTTEPGKVSVIDIPGDLIGSLVFYVGGTDPTWRDPRYDSNVASIESVWPVLNGIPKRASEKAAKELESAAKHGKLANDFLKQLEGLRFDKKAELTAKEESMYKLKGELDDERTTRIQKAKEAKEKQTGHEGEVDIGGTQASIEHEEDAGAADSSRGLEDPGRAADSAQSYLRRSAGADPKLFEGEGAPGRQSWTFRSWAESKGLALPPEAFSKIPVLSHRTAEHEVLFDPTGQTVIKRTRYGSFGYVPALEEGTMIRRPATPIEYLRRLALQNAVFGDKTRFLGVQQGKHGLILVTSQPYLAAAITAKANPPRREMEDYLESKGFRLDPIGAEIGGWRRDRDGVLISDARPDNFVKTKDGISPIDLQMAQTPEGAASMEREAAPLPENMPDLRAEGLAELKELLNDPRARLGGDVVRLALAMLDQKVMRDLDWSRLRVELRNRIEGAGAVGTTNIGQSLIQLTRAASPTTFPHEVFHFLYEMLPSEDRDRVEEIRRQAIGAEVALWGGAMPSEVRDVLERLAQGAGISSTEFTRMLRSMKDEHPESAEWLLSVYHLINASEYLAGVGAGRFSKDTFNRTTYSWIRKLWERIKGWLQGLLDSLRRLRSVPPDIEQLIRELLAGKYRNSPTGGEATDERRQFSVEPGDPDVPTRVFGQDDFVRGREQLTPSSSQEASDYAKDIFAKVGVPVVLLPAAPGARLGVWGIQPSGFDLNAEGRRLLQMLKKEIAAKNEPGKHGELLASLLNTIVWNFKAGRMDEFERPLREELYAVAQADRSQRGLQTGALAMHRSELDMVSQNLDVVLGRIWSDAYGGEDIRKLVTRVVEHFRDWFSDAEIEAALSSRPELREMVEKIIALNRRDEGGRVYRRVQQLLKPKMRKTLARLEGDARIEEAVEHILEQARRIGIEPKPNPNKKLPALQRLLLMVTPETAGKIDEAVAAAVQQAERNAGIKAALKAAGNDADREELQGRFDAGEEPEPEMVEEGLKLPEYAHWNWLRESILDYSPTTVKLAQDLIKQDFKGTRFGEQVQRPADTRIDLEKLAKQPDSAVRAGLDAYLQNLEANMDLAGATDETKQRVQVLVEAGVQEQLERARVRVRDPLFRERVARQPQTLTPEERAIAAVEQLLNAGLFADPRLNLPEMISRVAEKSKLRRLAPTITDMIKDVFATPFYRQQELSAGFANELISRLGIPQEQADAARAVFEQAFTPQYEKARARALEQAKASMTPQERRVIKPGAALWVKIERMVNAGGFDGGQVLQEIARSKGWEIPTEQQVRHLRDLAEQEMRMRELTPQEQAVAGGDPRAIERALADRAAATLEKRAAIIKQMGTIWSRFSRPVNFRKPWATRKNIAAAANEFEVADMLLKVGFAFRLPTHILTQLLVHVPTRAIGQAWINHQEELARGNPNSLIKEAALTLGSAMAGATKAIIPALNTAKAALAGRGEARNVDRLMSGIHLFERAEQCAQQYWDRGDYGRALFLRLMALPRFSLRFVQAVDNFQGVPAEYAQLRLQVRNALREQGRSPAEIDATIDRVLSGMKVKRDAAMGKAREILGPDAKEKEINEAAWHMVRSRIYEDLRDLGLEADDFRARNEKLRRTVAWQERVMHGPGGIVASLGRGASTMLQEIGLPLSFVRFSNAIGTGINYMLMSTPAYALAGAKIPGISPNEPSPWFETEEDIMQRRAQALLGSVIGALIAGLVLSGALVVRLFWPKDKEERELWEAGGHRPGTIEIRVGPHEFIPISMTVGPGSIIAPYAAAAGAVVDMFGAREKAQLKLNQEAQKRGLTPGKVRQPDMSDWLTVAGTAAWGTLMGNKAFAGVGQSVSEFGIPNSKKTLAAYVSPLVPGLPAWQEMSRMMGVNLDSKLASFADYLVPLPTSGARAVNMLGEPVGTPDDVQRVFQSIFAGSYPWVVNEQAGVQKAPYAAMMASGYRPPSIDPGKGYAIAGQYRPLTDEELARYTVLRGENMAREFGSMGVGADQKSMQGAFQRANQAALEAVGVETPVSAGPTAGGYAATPRGVGAALSVAGGLGSPGRATGQNRRLGARRLGAGVGARLRRVSAGVGRVRKAAAAPRVRGAARPRATVGHHARSGVRLPSLRRRGP